MEKSDNKKEENINSLCKKYFTPELCDEPGSESKRALQNELCKQLVIFGRSLWKQSRYKDIKNLNMVPDPTMSVPKKGEKDNRPVVSSAMEEAIYEAIGIFFAKCKTNPPNSYTAYFSAISKHEFNKSVDVDIDYFGKKGTPKEKIKEILKIAKGCKKNIEGEKDFVNFANTLGYSQKEINELVKYQYHGKNILFESSLDNDNNDDDISIFDDIFKKWHRTDGSNQENQVIAEETLLIIFKVIDDIYDKEKDKDFLSFVITFKILSDFNCSCTDALFSNLKKLLKEFHFTNKKLVDDFFNGVLPAQKDLERSQGSVNQKWKQFCDKLKRDRRITSLK